MSGLSLDPQWQMQSNNEEIILRLMADPTKADEAFKILVGHYGKPLYAVLYRVLENHPDTDDALQNTFIKAFRGFAGFRQDSSLSTWLHRIAVREGLTLLEKRKKHSSNTNIDTTELPFLPADSPFDGDKATQLLIRAVATLPEKQALVFKLRYYQEMPYEEMSTALSTSVGALKASFHHALKKVEAFLLAHAEII